MNVKEGRIGIVKILNPEIQNSFYEDYFGGL